jgi:CheY-like chemotaxis protein
MSNGGGARHVLVVEDDQDIRESVAEVLQDEGYQVSTAADGQQALDLLGGGERPPDIILLDLMMPVMSGFQFREEQLKRPELAAIPVLVVTADSNARGKAEALRVAGFVQKPLKIRPLLDLLEELLEPARSR